VRARSGPRPPVSQQLGNRASVQPRAGIVCHHPQAGAQPGELPWEKSFMRPPRWRSSGIRPHHPGAIDGVDHAVDVLLDGRVATVQRPRFPTSGPSQEMRRTEWRRAGSRDDRRREDAGGHRSSNWTRCLGWRHVARWMRRYRGLKGRNAFATV
jgi:hypothetical protein